MRPALALAALLVGAASGCAVPALDVPPVACEWDTVDTYTNGLGAPVIVRGSYGDCGAVPLDGRICDGPTQGLRVEPDETVWYVVRWTLDPGRPPCNLEA